MQRLSRPVRRRGRGLERVCTRAESGSPRRSTPKRFERRFDSGCRRTSTLDSTDTTQSTDPIHAGRSAGDDDDGLCGRRSDPAPVGVSTGRVANSCDRDLEGPPTGLAVVVSLAKGRARPNFIRPRIDAVGVRRDRHHVERAGQHDANRAHPNPKQTAVSIRPPALCNGRPISISLALDLLKPPKAGDAVPITLSSY